MRTRVGHEFSDEAATRKMHAEFTAAAVDPRHVVEPVGMPQEVAALVAEKQAAGLLRYPE